MGTLGRANSQGGVTMAGKRQPTALVEAKGRKHLSAAEKDARLDREVRAAVPPKAKPPQWLDSGYRAEFRKIGAQLIALGIYSDLDADTLGRYLIAQHQWLTATEEAEKALGLRDVKTAESWAGLQDKYFKQARNCACDLGLNVSSRCRLVLPQTEPPQESGGEDEFTIALRRRQAAMGE